MYIVECADGTYYVGATRDLERRLRQHNQGSGGRYTRGRRPVRLVYSAQFPTMAEAYRCERIVHGWRRARRKALIRGEIDLPGFDPQIKNTARRSDE
jgi:putative endonuclease